MKLKILLVVFVLFLIIPSASATETNWWDTFSDWFLGMFGVEPNLFFSIDDHNILGDTQEYILKTSIAEKDFDYEVKILSKKANIETWLEYYQNTICERQVIDKIVLDPLNLTDGGTKTIYKTEYYDCSSWVRATKQETQDKIISDNEFTKVRIKRRFGECPVENRVYAPKGFQPEWTCEQKVDVVISYSGREYIEYAVWEQTENSWNGIYSHTEDSAGDIVLTTVGADGTYLGFLFANVESGITGLTMNDTHFFATQHGGLKVHAYTITGTFVYDFAIQAGDNPQGIWVNETSIAHTGATEKEVYIYNIDGTFKGNWDTDASGNGFPTGITRNDSTWFIVDTTDVDIYMYDLSGSYLNKCNLSHNGDSSYGLYIDNTNIWVHDKGGGNQYVVKYDMGCNFVSQWSLDSNNSNSYGMATDGTYWYFPDDTDEGVHYYTRETLATEGNLTSSGFGDGTNRTWDIATYGGWDSCEFANSSDNITFGDYKNVTSGFDIGYNNIPYLKWRCWLHTGDTGDYVNVTYSTTADEIPNVDIASPTNITYNDITTVDFKWSSVGDVLLIDTNWYSLNSGGNITVTENITVTIINGSNTINFWANNTAGNQNTTSVAFFVNTRPTDPTINIPANNSKIGNTSVILNCSGSTDLEGDTIYYEFYVDANNPPTTQVNNTEYGWHNYTTEGDFWYRCRANDSLAYSSYTDPIYFQLNSVRIFNVTLNYTELAYETGHDNYNTTVTINKWNTEDITAVLEYNNTNYTATKTAGISNDDLAVFIFDKTINTAVEGADFTATGIWHFTLDILDGTTELNSSYTFTNEVSKIELARCNATFTSPFINFTFKDEDNSEYINGSIKSSTFVYSLDSAKALTKTFSFINNTDQESFAFCFEPLNQTLYTDIDLNYDSEGYPQRSYNFDSGLTNTTLNQILWLVSSGDGIYVTFQVINIAEQPISDVNVNVTRTISGLEEAIESGETGADGGFTAWLNPDLTYTATFTKSGYDSYTTSQRFTQSSYTITLGGVIGEIVENVTSYVQGIEYSVEPTIDVLFNNTDYNFNFTTISTWWDLERSGFTLTNSTGDVLGSSSCTTGTGCISSATINTLNYTYINMNYYWIIEGNYSNGTRSWWVYVTKQDDRRGSFQNLISDMDKLGSGFNDFTKAIFAFFIILFVVGTLCHYSGIYSPMAILLEVFFLVGFLDLIGFIPTPLNAVPHFITVIIGLICVGYFIFEYTR